MSTEQFHDHEWVPGCLMSTCTDCLRVCKWCRCVEPDKAGAPA